jgi:hypothetical protein
MDNFLAGRPSLALSSPSSTQAGPNGFQPLLFRSPGLASPHERSQPGCDEHSNPRVEVIQGESGIERIVVTCCCGKRIELKCNY